MKIDNNSVRRQLLGAFQLTIVTWREHILLTSSFHPFFWLFGNQDSSL